MSDLDRRDLQEHAYQITMAVNSLVTAMGMRAENQAREQQGMAPAYGEKEFNEVLDRNGTHHNASIGGWR